jgi:hypothetical protein
MATGLEKWGRSEFNYPTETTVNGIHEITAQPGSEVTVWAGYAVDKPDST